MKLAISLIIASILISCNPKVEETPKIDRKVLNNKSPYYDQQYETYTLEGCEYIVVGFGKSQWGSHKGNCKNPIHPYVKE